MSKYDEEKIPFYKMSDIGLRDWLAEKAIKAAIWGTAAFGLWSVFSNAADKSAKNWTAMSDAQKAEVVIKGDRTFIASLAPRQSATFYMSSMGLGAQITDESCEGNGKTSVLARVESTTDGKFKLTQDFAIYSDSGIPRDTWRRSVVIPDTPTHTLEYLSRPDIREALSEKSFGTYTAPHCR